jgi:hypothetical protein
VRGLVASAIVVAACGTDSPKPKSILPADYAATYVQTRPCRTSADHDLHNVKVYVDPGSVAAYQMRMTPFATGAVVVKEEYDATDPNCAGSIILWTVMVKLDVGSSPSTIDWHWQKIDPKQGVVTDDEPRCISCHTTCGVPPNGYDGTCSMP